MSIKMKAWPLLVIAATELVSGASAQEPALPPGLSGGKAQSTEPSLPPGLDEEPGLPSGLGGEPGLPPGLGGEPGLPSGLGGSSEPGLPPGLEKEEPSLPMGLGGDADPLDGAPHGPGGLLSFAEGHGIKGFLDLRAGTRTQRDPYSRTASIAEARLRLEAERQVGSVFLRGSTDLVVDPLFDSWAPDLETGQGFIDLREAYGSFSPAPWLDVKAGRQVLTWGTGDLPFINDLFPKDWVAFFTGREMEYLKAPSDAVRAGIFTDVANIDLVYTPRFDADRFIRGDRVSFYNPLLGRPSGRDAPVQTDAPDEWFNDSEYSARIYRNAGGTELAAYGYLGYWKSPAGFDAASGRARFPRLAVYGASARTQLAGGIASAEVGYYDSREDQGGDDPFVDNSEARILVGFERDLPEVAHSLTLGVQYYLEEMMQYSEYKRTLPNGVPMREESRHSVIIRVNKLLLEQRLTLSLYTYTSPTDGDTFLKPTATYAVDDSWSVTIGGNAFAGSDDRTFLNQFGPNTNVYAALRFSF